MIDLHKQNLLKLKKFIDKIKSKKIVLSMIQRSVYFSNIFFIIFKFFGFFKLSYFQKLVFIRPDLRIGFKFLDFYMVNVNPKKIKYVLLKEGYDLFKQNSYKFIINGDWDIKKVELRKISDKNPVSMIVESIEQLFIHNVDYKKSKQYAYMKECIENDKLAYWCKNISDIDKYFQNLYELFHDLKVNNYKTQKQIRKEKKVKLYRKINDEVVIYIDRNGELILGCGGTHRVLISSLLNLEEIPVVIIGIHNDWIRNYIKNDKIDILSSIKSYLEFSS